jgi:hypothetical protein
MDGRVNFLVITLSMSGTECRDMIKRKRAFAAQHGKLSHDRKSSLLLKSQNKHDFSEQIFFFHVLLSGMRAADDALYPDTVIVQTQLKIDSAGGCKPFQQLSSDKSLSLYKSSSLPAHYFCSLII